MRIFKKIFPSKGLFKKACRITHLVNFSTATVQIAFFAQVALAVLSTYQDDLSNHQITTKGENQQKRCIGVIRTGID